MQRRALILLSLLLPLVGNAQETTPATSPTEPSPAEPAPPIEAYPPTETPPVAAPWSSGHYWIEEGPRDPVAALAAGVDGGMLALLSDGTVMGRSPAGGWRRLLSPPEAAEGPDDEELLLDVESAVLELGDEQDEGGEVSVDDAVEAGILDSADRLAGGQASAAALGIWSDPRQPGLVLVSRSDGLWRSTDSGGRWARGQKLPDVVALVPYGERGLIAGTTDGLRHSIDLGRTWLHAHSPLDGQAITSLISADDTVVITTPEIALVSADGLGFAPLDLPPGTRSVGAADGAIWVDGPAGLSRLDGGDVGDAPDEVLGVADGPDGRLLIWAADGVWERVAGSHWSLIDPSGTPDGIREVAPLASADSGMAIVGGAAGLAVLDDTPPTALTAPVVPDGPPLVAVIGAALTAGPQNLQATFISRALVRRLLLPRVTAQGTLETDRSKAANYIDVTNSLGKTVRWEARLTLCFGGCSGSYDVDTTDYDYDSAVDVSIIGGTAYGDLSSTSDMVAAASRVSTRGSADRTSIIDGVTDTWLHRQRLVHEQAGGAGRPLAERVRAELDVREATAHLDALTDGYYSQALAGLTPSTER